MHTAFVFTDKRVDGLEWTSYLPVIGKASDTPPAVTQRRSSHQISLQHGRDLHAPSPLSISLSRKCSNKAPHRKPCSPRLQKATQTDFHAGPNAPGEC